MTASVYWSCVHFLLIVTQDCNHLGPTQPASFKHNQNYFWRQLPDRVPLLNDSGLLQDSQDKLVGLVWGLAATRRSVCIHQMNRVNSRSDLSRWQHHKHCHWLLLLLLCVCVRARTCEDMCGCIDVARNRESAITVHWSGAKFVTRDGWIS